MSFCPWDLWGVNDMKGSSHSYILHISGFLRMRVIFFRLNVMKCDSEPMKGNTATHLAGSRKVDATFKPGCGALKFTKI